MSRWKPVCDGLDPSVIRFVVELRRMKDESGLSLTQLANRTSRRSASSWERYLDGRALAPLEAVESLAKLVGADQTVVTALHRMAKDAWQTKISGDKDSSPTEGDDEDSAVARRPMGRPNERGDKGGGQPLFIPRTVVRLANELKALRERSGLSLVALASKTPYSKSSWSRWLSAKALPPWPAVQVLCRMVGEPEADLRALWVLAELEWSGREAAAAARATSISVSAPVAVPEPAISSVATHPDSRRFVAGVLVIAAGIALGCLVVALVVTYGLVW